MKNKVKLYGDVIKHFTKLDSLWWIANLYWVRLCRCFSYTRFVWGWLMSMFWFYLVCMRLIDVDVLVSSGLLCPISHLYQNSIQTHLMPSVKKIMIKKTVKSACVFRQCGLISPIYLRDRKFFPRQYIRAGVKSVFFCCSSYISWWYRIMDSFLPG